MTEPFVLTRAFAAPRDRVWAAWTDPKALAAWFGPKGSTSEMLEYDLRPGGLWRGRMAHPNGMTIYSRFTFREVTPQSRLVWEHSFADQSGAIAPAPFFDHWPLVILSTAEFTEKDGGTILTLTWTPQDASAEELATFEQTKPGMTGGWGGSFQQLDEYLAGR